MSQEPTVEELVMQYVQETLMTGTYFGRLRTWQANVAFSFDFALCFLTVYKLTDFSPQYRAFIRLFLFDFFQLDRALLSQPHFGKIFRLRYINIH